MKLVTRVELTLEEEAFMDATDMLEGYASERPEPGFVRTFLLQNSFRWSAAYVPIFVYYDDDDPNLPEFVLPFGRAFLLRNSEVLPDIELACCDDIQTSVSQGRPVTDFFDLASLKPEEKVWALREARNRTSRYAEARMYRPLRIKDIEKIL